MSTFFFVIVMFWPVGRLLIRGFFFFYRADENVYTLEFLLSAPLVKKDASEKALVENGGRYRWL